MWLLPASRWGWESGPRLGPAQCPARGATQPLRAPASPLPAQGPPLCPGRCGRPSWCPRHAHGLAGGPHRRQASACGGHPYPAQALGLGAGRHPETITEALGGGRLAWGRPASGDRCPWPPVPRPCLTPHPEPLRPQPPLPKHSLLPPPACLSRPHAPAGRGSYGTPSPAHTELTGSPSAPRQRAADASMHSGVCSQTARRLPDVSAASQARGLTPNLAEAGDPPRGPQGWGPGCGWNGSCPRSPPTLPHQGSSRLGGSWWVSGS